MIRFISCDWGTSSFRLRLIDGDGALSTNAGIAATHAEWQRSGSADRVGFFRQVLERAIAELASGLAADLQSVPVVLSGMASSSIGMLELPYRELPFDVSGSDLAPAVLPATAGSPRVLLLVPGVRSADDVMRGEETQLIGAGGGSGLFIFPGTHSKHMWIQEGKLVAFQTFMTGELFGLLSSQSILAGSVNAPATAGLPSAFYAGIDTARDSGLLHGAFITRTNQLFQKYNKEDNYHFLSGLLIGEELKASIKDKITLVAASPLRELYTAALAHLGFRDVAQIDADKALVAGHCTIFAHFGTTDPAWKNP